LSGLWGGNSDTISVICSGGSDEDGDDLDYNIQSNRTGAWTSVVDADEDGSYSWDINGFTDRFGIGLRCNATDGSSTSDWYPSSAGQSNLGIDNSGPWWNTPTINETVIAKNMYLDFNSTWADYNQTNLSAYIFAINQGAGYTNSSTIPFSTGLNFSKYTQQITASPGTTVYWYVWSNDTLGNENMTAVQNFNIANVPPESQNVNITPDDSWQNLTTANLTGLFTYFDADSEPIQANETKWYINDGEDSNLQNITWIHQDNTSAWQNWTFSARVYDGINWSNWVNSSVIEIFEPAPPPVENNASCNVSLHQYWNLLSFCALPENMSVENLTDTLNYRFIMRWNESSQGFDVYSPQQSVKPFTEFNLNESYFIYMYEDSSLFVNGNETENISIGLSEFWNNPSYPYDFNGTVDKVIYYVNDTYRFLMKWNTTGQEFMVYSPQQEVKPFDNITVGEGILINLNAPTAILTYNRS